MKVKDVHCNDIISYLLYFIFLAGGSFITSTSGDLDDSDDDDDGKNEDDGEIHVHSFENCEEVVTGNQTEWEKTFKPMKLPKELVFEPLPLRFATNVDTRVKPDVPPDSMDRYKPNCHPITRRRYFVYCNDRMKKDSYNLHLDNVVHNPRKRLAEEVPAMGEILEEPTREYIDNKVT